MAAMKRTTSRFNGSSQIRPTNNHDGGDGGDEEDDEQVQRFLTGPPTEARVYFDPLSAAGHPI